MTVRYGVVFVVAFALLVVLLGMGITTGLTAIVIAFWFQYQELKLQRLELESQRHALDRSQSALNRSAEADLRALHVELLKMSIDDCDLAKVWPWLNPEMSDVEMKQFLFANLIIQYQRLALDTGRCTEAEMRLILRRLFRSPMVRDYWRTSLAERASVLAPESDGWNFERLVQDVFSEPTDPSDHDLHVA